MRSCLSNILSTLAFVGFGATGLVHLVALSEGQWISQLSWFFWLLAITGGALYFVAEIFEVARSRGFVFTIWPRYLFASMPWSGRIAVVLTWVYMLVNIVGYLNALGRGAILNKWGPNHALHRMWP